LPCRNPKPHPHLADSDAVAYTPCDADADADTPCDADADADAVTDNHCEHCMDPKAAEDNFRKIQEFADNMTAVLEDHLVQIYIRLDRLDGRGGPR
jgi:hypothetical protein